MGNNSKSKITPYLYLVPCMLIFGVFLFYPFVKTIYLSLYKTNKMGQAKLYVGLDNYKELIQSASFINSLKVTLIFVLIVVVGGMLLGLIAAVLCNKAFPGIRVFSTSYALPMAIASSSAAMIFQIMLHPAVGIVNKLLGLDIEGEKVDALVKNIDYNPIEKQLMALDFQALVAGEKVSTTVAIKLEHTDMVQGIVEQEMEEVHYKADPANLLDTIVIDFDGYPADVRDIHVKDLPIPEGKQVHFITPEDAVVVHIGEYAAAPEEDEEAEDAEAETK